MGIKNYLQKKKKEYWRIAILNGGTPSPWMCDCLVPVSEEIYFMFTLQEVLEIEADREIIWMEILQMLPELD